MIKLTKYSYYTETERCVQWLEAMALQGWKVEKFTRNLDFMWFRKDFPQRVHYCFYFNDQYLLDEPSFIESARVQGWINLNKNPILARAFLFVSPLSEPMPLETDDLDQGSMYKTMHKKPNKFLWFLIVLSLVLMVFNLLTRGWMFLFLPSLLSSFTILLWSLEYTVMPRKIKRLNNAHRRQLAMLFRSLRFSIIPLWVVSLAFYFLKLLPI